MPGKTYTTHYREMLRRLRAARTEADLTQIEAAEALGFTQTQVSKIERGERRIDAIELKNFATLYGVRVETLIP